MRDTPRILEKGIRELGWIHGLIVCHQIRDHEVAGLRRSYARLAENQEDTKPDCRLLARIESMPFHLLRALRVDDCHHRFSERRKPSPSHTQSLAVLFRLQSFYRKSD